MIVSDFQNSCFGYTNFQIWEVDSMEAFFEGSPAIPAAFEHLYQMPLAEFAQRRSEIENTELEIMKNILDHVGDKHFYVFTYHSDNHAVLVHLQEHKVMNFGVDINDVRKNCVYVCIMDELENSTSSNEPSPNSTSSNEPSPN
jgi:hypothetical protein